MWECIQQNSHVYAMNGPFTVKLNHLNHQVPVRNYSYFSPGNLIKFGHKPTKMDATLQACLKHVPTKPSPIEVHSIGQINGRH